MSSDQRPIGAAKDKQSDTEALCRPPPPLALGHEQLEGMLGAWQTDIDQKAT